MSFLLVDHSPLQTRWEFKPRYHELPFSKKHSSTALIECIYLLILAHLNSGLLYDYFIFNVSLIEFTNFSPNTVITLNNKLWIITETLGF